MQNQEYRCKICGESFTSKQDLDMHMIDVHQGGAPPRDLDSHRIGRDNSPNEPNPNLQDMAARTQPG